MAYVFYDTETTGTETAFDQILQFAAIRTDDDLNELDRFEIRCRLLPYVVPAPGALRVTGVTVAQLTDPALPSHYAMVQAIRARLLAWSPAVFIGYNSIRFDEPLLRQAFYQTLHPPYLTSQHDNGRQDALGLVQSASLLAPGKVEIPTGSNGKPSFKLDLVAPANGFAHDHAHDALADVEATIYLCRRVRTLAPELWPGFERFSRKAEVIAYLRHAPAVGLVEFYFGRPSAWPVTLLREDIGDGAALVADLSQDIERLGDLDDAALTKALAAQRGPLRRVRPGNAPLLLTLDALIGAGLVDPERGREAASRAERLQGDTALCEGLLAAFAAGVEPYPPAEHVEQKIYEGFPGWEDGDRMREFHDAPWESRAAIARTIEDARYRTLAERLLFVERPDLLDPARRVAIEHAIAVRLLGLSGEVPWRTIPQAVQECEALLGEDTGDGREIVIDYRDWLVRREVELGRLVPG